MKKLILLTLAVLLIFGFAVTESKASLVYTLDSVYNGATPTSTPPWLTIAFEDIGSTVKVTITSSLNVASEFFGQLGFNAIGGNPTYGDSLVKFPGTVIGADPVVTLHDHLEGTANLYDVLVSFDVAPPADRFNDADKISFILNGVSTTNFTGLQFGDIAAHLQGIPLNGGTTSGVISTPIPAAAWLLGSGLLGLVVVRRRMKK